jgi:hypothetical protein
MRRDALEHPRMANPRFTPAIFAATGITAACAFTVAAGTRDGIGWFFILSMFFTLPAIGIFAASFGLLGKLPRAERDNLAIMAVAGAALPALLATVALLLPNCGQYISAARHHLPFADASLRRWFWEKVHMGLFMAPGGALGAILVWSGWRRVAAG